MDDRIQSLYEIPEYILPQDHSLVILREQALCAEEKVRMLAQTLSEQDRAVLEVYMELRDELEFQSVKQALRFGKWVKSV